MAQGGHLHRRLVFPKSTPPSEQQQFPIALTTADLNETLTRIRRGFESDDGSGRSAICDCSHDWKTSPEKIHRCSEAIEEMFREGLTQLSQPYVFEAKFLPTPPPTSATAAAPSSSSSSSSCLSCCQIEAKILPDPFSLPKFILLSRLKLCRQSRHKMLLELSELLSRFGNRHHRLLEIRKILRHEKFPTRGERKEILEQAIDAENELARMEKRALELSSLICDQGRREVKYFTKLIPVQRECCVFELMDSRRDPLQVSSEIDKELLVDWGAEDGGGKGEGHIYQDQFASETSPHNEKGIDPGSHLPSWPRHYIEHLIATHFLPAIEEVKITEAKAAPKKKHYAKFAPMSGQYQYSKRGKGGGKETAEKEGKSNKEEKGSTEIPLSILKMKTARDLPGLRKYLVSHFTETRVYEVAVETRRWSAELSRWFQQIEQHWKQEKFQLCLSFLQRARHLLNSGMRYCVVKATDTRLATVIRNADALDLFQLLLCRGGVSMKVLPPSLPPSLPPHDSLTDCSLWG
jgi:hypothetical protein